MLTLGDLLDHEAFGLDLLTGGDRARRRPVAGAHTSEIPNPSRFLPPHWVMLTLGIRLYGRPAEQRALVAELVQAKVTALGFGTGVTFKRVPKALLDEAERLDFPVFHIPYETPYREIVGFVNRSLLSADFHALQRSLSMQSYLMDAFREKQPVQALVDRLGKILNSTVLLFGPDGTLEASSGSEPAGEVWAAIDRREQQPQTRTVRGANLMAVPIPAEGTPQRWLAVLSRRTAISPQLATSVIQTTERLLDVIELSRRAAAAQDRVLRSELLWSLAHPRRDFDPIRIRAHMENLGFDLRHAMRVVVAGLPSSTPDTATTSQGLARARDLIEDSLARRGMPYLLALRQARLTLVLPDDLSTTEVIFDEVADKGAELAGGVSRPLARLDEVSRARADAELALEQCLRGPFGRLLPFERIGMTTWLVRSSPSEVLVAKAEALLGEIKRNVRLYETLIAYLTTSGDVGETARRLHVHRNTLRYRLSRIEALVGASLRDLPTLTDLYIATLVDRAEIGDRVTAATASPTGHSNLPMRKTPATTRSVPITRGGEIDSERKRAEPTSVTTGAADPIGTTTDASPLVSA